MLINLMRRASFWMALFLGTTSVVAVGQEGVAPAVFQPADTLESVKPQRMVDKPGAIHAPGSTRAPIELRPPENDVDIGTLKRSDGSMVKVMASLGAVLALFGMVAWFLRRKAPNAMRNLPKDAFEIYGRATLNSRQYVQLLRVGNRLILVAVSTNGAHTLTEITDSAEIDRLQAICQVPRQPVAQPGSHDTGVPHHLVGVRARDEMTFTESRHE